MRRNTQKQLLVTCAAFLVLTASGIGIRALVAPDSSGNVGSSVSDAGRYEYLIRDYNGKIAVFEYGGGDPLEVFDVYTDALPAADQAKVKTGIKLYSRKELQKAIEEYTS